MSYYVNQVFQDPILSSSATFIATKALLNNFQVPDSGSLNPALIFGDFMSVFNILKALLLGTIYDGAFGDHGLIHGGGSFADASLQLLMGILNISSLLFFFLYIISNRSI